jgi:hypothetical protein
VVVANATLGAVTVLFGAGDPSRGPDLRAPVRVPTGGQGAWAVAVGDLDGDGRPDVAVALHDSAELVVLRDQL